MMKAKRNLIWMHDMPASLEYSIFNTLRYFDIFDLPLTVVQIWRSLIVDAQPRGLRWKGQAMPSLNSVRTAFKGSAWLRERVGFRWGYYFLKGRETLVDVRLRRQVLAAHKWKIIRRVARLLAFAPFVRMIGVTGSLSLSHTRPESDLDLFLVVRRNRIWTARLFAVVLTQIIGRRRKYWDRQAPDKACLNHYITDDSLLMVPAVRSLYTAVLYAHLVPLMGFILYERWQDANMVWMKRWLMRPVVTVLAPRQAVRVPKLMFSIKRLVESWLLEFPGEALERWAGTIQRRTIGRHTIPGRSGRIAVSDHELAFHPDSKELGVLRRFYEEYGQRAIL